MLLTDPRPMDMSLYHSLPDADSGQVKGERYRCGDYEIRLLKNPVCRSGFDLVDIMYSVVALKNNRIYACANLEREDLRALANSIGCSLKDIQGDYNTRDIFSETRLFVYGGDEREDLGRYDGDMDLESVKFNLMDTVLDTLDLLDEILPF